MNTYSPTVSIIIPVYNVAPYVDRCILSVMRQSFSATECVIVDDGSKDDSIDRCQRLIDLYKGTTRFTIIHHQKNRGLSAARNTGTDAATSDYIYYVDSDDELTPDCLEKLVAPVMEDNSIEMVMGAYATISIPRTFRRMQFLFQRIRFRKNMPMELRTNEEVYRWYYQGIRPVCVWNKLLKLAFVRAHGLYNKEGLLYEDSLWTFYLMRFLRHAAFVHDVTYFYHRNHHSIRATITVNERCQHFSQTFKDMTAHLEEGKRIEETARWAFLFGNLYIDAYDIPDYQQLYDVYYRELKCGKKLALWRLKSIHFLAKRRTGRIFFKTYLRIRRIFLVLTDDIKILKMA